MTENPAPAVTSEGSPRHGRPPSRLAYMEMTANEVVAHNLTRARRMKGWTQGEAAARLEQESGKTWTAATLGAAERSASSSRVRQFDANELLGFSLVFEQPIAFFMIPPDLPDSKIVIRSSEADRESGYGVSEQKLLDSVVPLKMTTHLVDDVERVLNKYGLTWSPGVPRFEWYRPEQEDISETVEGGSAGVDEAPPIALEPLNWNYETIAELRERAAGDATVVGVVDAVIRDRIKDIVSGVFQEIKESGWKLVKDEDEQDADPEVL